MERLIIKQLKQWKTSMPRKPLILRGARQVGKTYILKKFGSFFSHCHYIDFENEQSVCSIFEKNLDPDRIISELQFYLEKRIEIKKDLLIFDEIQNCPNALTALKYFNEKMPEIAICAAGSLLGIALNDASFPVGRVTFISMYPMNFYEFLLATASKMLVDVYSETSPDNPLAVVAHQKLFEQWKIYLIVGGLPDAVKVYSENKKDQFSAFQKVRQTHNDLFTSYMMDIAKHSGKTNAAHTERIWRNIPTQLGKSINGNVNRFKFKGVIPGINGYERLSGPIKWLEAAQLAIRVSSIDTPNIPLISHQKENRFKLYFFDMGLLSSISNLKPQLILNYNFGSYKGYFVENFAAIELTNIGIRELFSWEGRTSEVEFLLETPAGVIPVEIKSGWVTQAKSLKVYNERYKPETSIIISARNFKRSGNRTYIPLYAIEKIERLYQL